MNLRSQTKPGNPLVCNMFSYSLFYTLSIKINVCISSDVADILLKDKSLLHYSAVISDNYSIMDCMSRSHFPLQHTRIVWELTAIKK